MGLLPELDSNGLLVKEVTFKPTIPKAKPYEFYFRTKLRKKRRKKKTSNHFIGPYDDYIKSKKWKRRRIIFYKKNGRACVICRSTKNIHVHHIVYEKYGMEKDEHLALVCREHHIAFHEKFGSQRDMTVEWQLFVNECKEQKWDVWKQSK